MDRAHSPALQEMRRRRRVPKKTSAMPISSIYYETRVCTGRFPMQFADDHLRRFMVVITNDRTQTIFALHESAFGTKRTSRDDLIIVRFRGEADMRRGVAPTASVADDPTRTVPASRCQTGRLSS